MEIYNVQDRPLLKKLDLNFMFLIFSLNLIGLIILYSATHGPDSKSIASLFLYQLLWLSSSWLLFILITLLDYILIMKAAFWIYLLNILALVFTFFYGKIALGAQRWIDFGFFKFQPSETMKLAVIILLARVLAKENSYGPGMGFKSLFLPLVILLIPFTLIVEQPDLGTAMTMMAIGGSMILFVKVKKGIIYSLIIALAIAIPMAWKFVLHDYQKNRVRTFLSPTSDPRGTGYNSIQSKIAVGSGMFIGKGFRKGTQSQLEFLPERHTDFIYSVLSEEFGFVGSVLTLGLFMALYVIGLRISSHARDKFGALLCVGIISYIFWHMFINIGMVIGLLPIVGVPLPLLSYGGSSMLTTMLGLGIVSSVAYRRYIF